MRANICASWAWEWMLAGHEKSSKIDGAILRLQGDSIRVRHVIDVFLGTTLYVCHVVLIDMKVDLSSVVLGPSTR